MSEEELKNLKEELKREILNEMTTKQLVKDDTWTVLKKEFRKMFYSKGYTESRDLNKIFEAISNIARLSLGYRRVQAIPVEKTEELKQIMYKILNIFPNKNKEAK